MKIVNELESIRRSLNNICSFETVEIVYSFQKREQVEI